MERDLVIIGAGPGGYTAALHGAKRGAGVCLIEQAAVGGDCLNYGCIPTKTLAASAELYARMRRAADFGLEVDQIRPNVAKIIKRKDDVVARLAKGLHQLLKQQGVELITGKASFLSSRELAIDNGQARTILEAKRIIIAAGTVPYIPSSFSYDGESVLTTDDALKLADLPASLVIIGGGVLGCEFASIFNALGVETAIVERFPSLIPSFDAELGQHLSLSFKRRGIRVYTGQIVEGIEKGAAGVRLCLASGEVLEAHRVLLAMGRKTAWEGLQLEKAGLVVDEGGKIPVGPDLRTKIPWIYAIGDINNIGPDLAHVASEQGLAVAEGLFARSPRVFTANSRVVPRCVFTDPEVASVGLTEAEAAEKGIKVRVNKFSYLANGKALALGEREGWVKLVAAEEGGRIIGAQIFGTRAAELIAEATLAISHGLTAGQLASLLHAHPTLTEAVMEAAGGLAGLGLYE